MSAITLETKEKADVGADNGFGRNNSGESGLLSRESKSNIAQNSENTSSAEEYKTYVYTDREGNPICRKVRKGQGEAKTFFFQHPGRNGEWLKGRGKAGATLYKLHKLAGLNPGDTVYIVEGEKDADRIMKEGSGFGLVATTNPEGAGKWRKEYNELFRGLNVVVCGDNDQVGSDHAEAVAAALHGTAASLKAALPSVEPKGDISDWLDAGNSIEDFLRELDDTPLWQPPKQKPDYACTDTGNAERLALVLNGDAKWNKAFGWCRWDDKLWELDQEEQLLFDTKQVFQNLRAEADSITGGSKEAKKMKQELRDWAKKTEGCPARQRVMTLLKGEPSVWVKHGEFDQNHWLLNTGNLMLDLSLLKNDENPVVPRAKELMVTHILPVEYDPDAECPRWERFMSEIFEGRQEIIEFVQKMAGYSMTGDTREQCLFILHGNGHNGKSTMLNVLDFILGPLSRSAAIETFCTRRGDKIPEDRAVLRQARLVRTSEVVDKQHTLDLGFIKDATGGDKVSGRLLHKDTFEYAPQFKIWMACNARPHIPNRDKGTWRRIRLIPFNARFDGEKDNRNLKAELMAERSGILNWLLEGCRSWQREGLNSPEAVLAATEEYKNDSDSMGDFFSSCVTKGEDLSMAANALYDIYARHCVQKCQSSMSSTAFGRALTERGFIKKHTRDGNLWCGLEARSPEEGVDYMSKMHELEAELGHKQSTVTA